MSVQLTVAIISAAVAVASILLSARTARSNTVLQARLQTQLEQRREQASKASRLEDVVSRYRDPLLSAAFDLQSRIWNFVVGGFTGYLQRGDADEKNYVVNSTLFVIAQYLAWVEALRRGVQFLDLGDVERSRELATRLEAIRSTFSTDTRLTGPFRVFRAEQRAIGELMLEPGRAAELADMPWQCIGYAVFCSKLEHDQSFAGWFARLEHDIRSFISNFQSARPRLAALQNTLMDLIDFLDDPPLRFSMDLRSRIPDTQPAPEVMVMSQSRSAGSGAADPVQ